MSNLKSATGTVGLFWQGRGIKEGKDLPRATRHEDHVPRDDGAGVADLGFEGRAGGDEPAGGHGRGGGGECWGIKAVG